MSRPEKLIPARLEEAVAELKRDPSHPVHARVDGLDFELRIIPSNETQPRFGSRLAAIGPLAADRHGVQQAPVSEVRRVLIGRSRYHLYWEVDVASQTVHFIAI